ncbi:MULTISPECIES: DUF4359 domain-containing protein [unclassified Synechococcus]|uniref:DUF4359 domain-containing protein n=1 Tax=unclassified Synechococcus TaxID=2626047 RepID=UPI0021A28379|nr:MULTISPECIES: DUF4359 domain-containing protein [unclassified Synechococcus]
MPTVPPTPRRRWRTLLLAAAGLGGASLALAANNPGPADFEAFAAGQLVERATAELCGPDGLPMALRLVIQNCPELIRSQRDLLGSLAAQGSERQNFVVFSLYRTAIGGRKVLPFLGLPTYRALTLAGAGQFVILTTSSDRSEPASRQQGP